MGLVLGLGLGLHKQNNMFLLGKDPAFKITIDTTKAGSASDTFVLPLNGSYAYDFVVDWGDGNSESVTTNTDVTHTYASSGTYQIAITGTFPSILFNNSGDKAKLIEVTNIGDVGWQTLEGAFYGCSNMTTFKGYGVTSDVTSTYFMFRDCSSFDTFYDTYFDTSNVTNMSRMFLGCSSFNQSVSNFDTSNVTDMNRMFFGCSSFNQSVSNFDTSNVTDMGYMFYGCSSFNQPISFDTANVTNMYAMFYGCSSFNQSVSNFDTSNVTNMNRMFLGCSSFNQSVSNFDTSNVTDMGYMFSSCSAFKQDISHFSIESVTDIDNMLLATNINESGTTTNYDNLLVSFESQAGIYSKTGLNFHGGNAQYSATGETARNSLTAATPTGYGWTITDAGLVS